MLDSLGGPLVFALLVAAAVMIGFVALWRMLRGQDEVEDRLAEYGVSVDLDEDLVGGSAPGMVRTTGLGRVLYKLGFGEGLSALLSTADVPMTAAEFSLIIVAIAVVGFLLGSVRAGLLGGLGLAAVGGVAPIMWLRSAHKKRQRALTEQLPDALTLLVGALRAGYGFSQALAMLVDQLPKPASVEFARVMRAVTLGQSMQVALNNMAQRVDTEDMDLVITAINVQYEMGGNLAQTLGIIGETVEDRIRMQREIQVLTAQQRFTGYALAALPLGLGFVLFLLNPEYIKELFQPGWPMLMPIVAGVMQIMGFFVIRKVVDIEV